MSTWYEKSVFYHMYPLGMTGAPKENSESAAGCRLSELENWIPHLQNMGVGAIYIGPLFESASHGYDTIDYRKVDRRLGTNEDFKQFVRLCHKANIHVIVDGVFNHTGRGFFAFRDLCQNREHSPYRDWYRGLNFSWDGPMGDGFSYESWQGHCQLPCLNLQNPEVRRYLLDVVHFWYDTFQIDGIRLDCANVLDFGFMEELRREAEAICPDFWLMGEVIHGDYSRWVNERMLHSVTNYELHKSLYSGLNDHNFFEIAHNVRRLESIGTHLYTFLDNHDEDRIASKLKKREHLPLAYLLLFTLPGIPSVYYGGEWAVEGKRTRFSDINLRPALTMQEAESLPPFLLGEQTLLSWLTNLAHIHRSHPEFAGGRYQELLLTNRQYAYARHGQGSAVITAINCDDQSTLLVVPLPFHAQTAQNLMDGSIIPITDGRLTLTLPSNYGAIFKIRED